MCKKVDCIYHMPSYAVHECNYYFITGETKTGQTPYSEKYSVETCQFYQCGVRVKAVKESPLATPNNVVVISGLKTMRENKDKAIKMYDSGMNDIDIAKSFGVSPQTIARWRRNNGLKAKKHKSIDWEMVESEIKNGKKFAEIAEMYKVDQSAIEIYAERRRLHERSSELESRSVQQTSGD